MTTVEQAASQAAGITSDYDESSELSTAYRKGYTVGYLAGHASRDAEIAEKSQEVRDMELSSEMARTALDGMRILHVNLIAEKDAEIANLRSRLEEAEARAAKWVRNASDENYDLLNRGWMAVTVSTRGAFALMVPNVPLPEAEP